MATIFRRSMVKDERLSDNILFWKGFAKNVLRLNFCSTARLFDVMFLKCQSRKTSDEPTKAHTVALSAMNVKKSCVSPITGNEGTATSRRGASTRYSSMWRGIVW